MNGSEYSKCTANCTWKEDCGNPTPPVCGNGIPESGEECDDGAANGSPSSSCTTDCKKRCHTCESECGDGVINAGEECDDGAANGTPSSDCDASCHKKTQPPPSGGDCCEVCNPNPFYNKCTITTSCISTPSTKDYCACRAGYRASGLDPTDKRQFRLAFPGQEYRVFVAPGIDCDALCTNPFPGPDSCQEVPVRDGC